MTQKIIPCQAMEFIPNRCGRRKCQNENNKFKAHLQTTDSQQNERQKKTALVTLMKDMIKQEWKQNKNQILQQRMNEARKVQFKKHS